MRWILFFCALLFLGLPQRAQAERQVYPLSKVKPGLRGRGVTVLSAAKLTPFDVEVLGVLHNFIGPGQDLILARLHGPEIEHTGVISGMSGSPVYVDGQLLGAVSYRLGSFSKEPIAGITPAALMLAAAPSPALAKQGPKRLGRLTTAAQEEILRPFAADLQAIENKIVLSSAAPSLLAHYAPRFAAAGLHLMRGGAQSSLSSSPGTASQVFTTMPARASTLFVPGGPLAAVLIAGDVNMAATGTVTMVQGDRVIGFGHPFLGRGTSVVPLAQAEIVTTLASQSGSFKIASIGDIVGQFTDDRSVAVVATVGKKPPMMHLDIKLSGEASLLQKDAKRDYHFMLAEDPVLTPLLAELAVASAVGGRIGFDIGGHAEIDLKLKLPGQPKIHVQDIVSVGDQGNLAADIAAFLAQRIGPLWRNPYQAVSGLQAQLGIKLFSSPKQRRIVALHASPLRLCPGDELRLAVDSITYRGARLRGIHQVQIPQNLSAGKLRLDVGGIKQMKDIDKDSGRLPFVNNFGTFLDRIKTRRRADRLYLVLSRKVKSPRLAGQTLEDLPLSYSTLLASGSQSGSQAQTTRLRLQDKVLESGFVVSGGAHVDVQILSKECE